MLTLSNTVFALQILGRMKRNEVNVYGRYLHDVVIYLRTKVTQNSIEDILSEMGISYF